MLNFYSLDLNFPELLFKSSKKRQQNNYNFEIFVVFKTHYETYLFCCNLIAP